ncbi:MAG: hypothetical protein KGI51_10340, partial [Rhodospirillales bacterium]|nr:hypothetical protein [Rhodospirillales bacterium]
MSQAAAIAPETARPREVSALYAKLEERILARDQVGASGVYYDLVRAGRPLPEMLAEAVRIHGPYTHVPYHQRIDDGYPNFVNNDHCLLSARATLNLNRMVPGAAAMLPMAQTIWYIPTGLDIWNQKIGNAPGHYMRGFRGGPVADPPAPQIYWQDQEPLREKAPLSERLGHWMTLVERGQVIEAYRVFLGLMEERAHRREVLGALVFAGLIDVQDRMLFNKSYTTGHKAYRARSTVEIGNAIGWDRAHDVLYAGALDMAVGPRWYSVYEMGCNAVKMFIDGEALHAVPYGGASERETAMLAQTEKLNQQESAELIEALIRAHEPAYVEKIAALLRAGKDPRRILDAMQIAAAELVLETRTDTNFSMPHHCYEYCNTLGWFYDNFDHGLRLKLLFVAGNFLNQVAWHQQGTSDSHRVEIAVPAGADKLPAAALLERVEGAIVRLDGPESLAWTQAALDQGVERARIAERVALAACRIGNDPHNQEIAQCMLEDYAKNRSPDRDKLLLAAAWHTAMHRKYG